jgi:hypothetical protein
MNPNEIVIRQSSVRSLYDIANTQFRPTRCALAVALALATSVATAIEIRVNAGDVTVTEDKSCSIQEAITAANTDTAVDTCPAGNGPDIIVLPGNSQFTLQNIDNQDQQGNNGLPIITSNIIIRGHNAIIKRSSDTGTDHFRIFRVVSGNLRLNSVTIENGLADFTDNGISAPGVYGGGIYAFDSTVTLISSTVSGNTAAVGGGISSSESVISIIESEISNNDASGINANKSTITIQDSNISYNRAHLGGGMVINNSTLSMTNSTVVGNHANTFGGGLGGQFSTINIDGSTIRDNRATDYDGGGIQFGGSTLNLSTSTVSGNTSGRDGGGIKLDENSQGKISSSTISRNTAGRGGGGVEIWTNQFNIANSTISTNTASTKGGGLAAWYGASVTLTNTTIAENNAQIGSGAYSQPLSSLFFKNSIVGNNKVGANCAGEGTTDSGSNVFADTSCSGITQGDPKLGPLQINGVASTETHGLLSGSPALDAGDNSFCAENLIANLDQRGLKRPFDGDADGTAICDIGAHENHTVLAPAEGKGIQPAHSGAWFDTSRSGEGYFIYISNNNGQRSVTIAYYTYDNGKQMWVIGTEPIATGSSTVIVPMTVTTGTAFSNFDPTEVKRANWGTLTLTFTSCDAGTISYDSPQFGSGITTISRLATVSGITCNSSGF